MPTGYTAGVEDGTVTELRDFVLTCARGMGACIMQRDDPLTNPPKHRVVDTYYLMKMEQSQLEVLRLESMSVNAAQSEADLEYETAVEEHRESLQRCQMKRERYASMLDKVKGWVPPTPDHDNLKKFMIDQIQLSTRFDSDPPEPVRWSGEDWLEIQRKMAAKDVDYYRKNAEEEVSRCESTNQWIDELYNSFK